MVAVVVAAMFFYVGAPAGTAVQIAGVVFGLSVLAAFLYNIFGLSIPRLRNAEISLWTLLLLFMPLGPVIMFVLCIVARERA